MRPPSHRALDRHTRHSVGARCFAWVCALARLGFFVALTGCATMPAQPVERALYMDARKALRAESRLGWTVDRVEIVEAAVQTEQSACQVAPAHRGALKDWVAGRIDLLGGSASSQYERGVPLSDLHELIDLEHARALLTEVEAHVPEDCPFWLRPREDFSGIHTGTHRFVVLAESMGGGSLSIVRGKVRAGAGGGARLFGGYGLSERMQLALGIEAGGEAVLQSTDEGALEPEGLFRFGIPVLARFTNLDRIYDVELATVTGLTDGTFKPWGGRLSLAGGVAGLRRLGFMPALQVWVGYEVYPPQDGQPTRHIVHLGTRVGVDWDP